MVSGTDMDCVGVSGHADHQGENQEKIGEKEKIRHSTIVDSVTSVKAGDQEDLVVGNSHVLLERELSTRRGC